MKRHTLVLVLYALLFTNLMVAANTQDIEKLSDKCAHFDQKACEKLKVAIGKMTDQALLTKMAVDDRDPYVRTAAVGRLTDQMLLAKIAIEDKNRDVRMAAVGKLTDQALLAKIAVEDKNIRIRMAAAGQVTDQTLLAKITVDDRDGFKHLGMAGEVAFKKLTDQTLLAKIAMEDKDQSLRIAALRKLTNQTFLARVAVESKDPIIRSKAIGAMDESNPALKRFIGLADPSDDTGRSIARIKLSIQEPRIRNRFPGILLTASIDSISQPYGPPGATIGFASLSGETVSFVLSQGGRILAKKGWSTAFPGTLYGNHVDFIPAKVHGEELLAELLNDAVFTQDDLTELSSTSEFPELRWAAKQRLAQIQNNPK